jgi:DNA transposition AAA+ family ATPase
MIFETVKQEIENSKLTRYAIYKQTGVNQAVLCKIVNGDQTGISVKNADTLLRFFNYDLIKREGKQ